MSPRRNACALLVVALLCVTDAGIAHASGQQAWARQASVGASGTLGTAVTSDPGNGNVYVLLHTGTGSKTDTIAYSAQGTRLWTVSTGHAGDEPEAITVDAATHIVLVAVTRGADLLVQAYSADGSMVWSKLLGSTNGRLVDAAPGAIAVDGHGRLFVAGTSSGQNSDYLTVAYQVSTGAVLWHRRYDGSARGDDAAIAVAVDPGLGLVYVVGHTDVNGALGTTTVAYVAGDGTQQWTYRSSLDSATGISVDPANHHVYAVAENESSPPSSMEIIAYSSAGSRLWRQDVTTTDFTVPAGIAVDPGNGRVYVAGTEFTQGGGTPDILAAYAADGTPEWVDVDNAGGGTMVRAVAIDTFDHRVFVTGNRRDASGEPEFLTFADSAAGTRQWTEGHRSPDPDGEALPASIATDPTRAQVYVLGIQTAAAAQLDAETIAYHA